MNMELWFGVFVLGFTAFYAVLFLYKNVNWTKSAQLDMVILALLLLIICMQSKDNIAINPKRDVVVEMETEYEVYISKSGERYHYYGGCSNGEYVVVPESLAVSMGYTPCKKCIAK